jgi:hypothetical protein
MSGASPIEAKITRWDAGDRVGELELNTGETVRFGGTACKNLAPAVGMTVFVNALGPHPLGGRKALIVRSDPFTEEEAAVQDVLRSAAENAAKLRPLLELEEKLPPLEDDEAPSPSIDLRQALDPETQKLLRTLDEESDGLLELDFEVEVDGSPPWPFYDPSLWSLGHDGGGNVFALHYYPPSSRVPVVFWDHELHMHFFQAEGLAQFLGQFIKQRAAPRKAQALSKRFGVRLADAGADRLRDDGVDALDWPLPTARDLEPVALSAIHRKERKLVRALVEASHDETFQRVIEPLSGLDAIYRELGWSHHLSALREQRADWFEQQRNALLRR